MSENPWLHRRVINYAHQGGAFEGPSSTLFAIEQALQNGAVGIELDVHMSADGHLVVCHDASVDRTTNGTGAIATLTLKELQSLDNAYWFSPGADVSPGLNDDAYPYRGRAPKDREFSIATLEEVLTRFPNAILNLDIKQSAPTVAPYEAHLAQMLRRFDRKDDVIVASFLDGALVNFREIAPEIPTSAGTLATLQFWRSVKDGAPCSLGPAVALQVPLRRGDVVVLDQGFVDAAHKEGVAVHVWTINEKEDMTTLIDLGVDGIVSDRPSVLSSVLSTRGVSWG